jgi:hypothetical protein
MGSGESLNMKQKARKCRRNLEMGVLHNRHRLTLKNTIKFNSVFFMILNYFFVQEILFSIFEKTEINLGER